MCCGNSINATSANFTYDVGISIVNLHMEVYVRTSFEGPFRNAFGK